MDALKLQEEFATALAAGEIDMTSWIGLLPDLDEVLQKRGESARVLQSLLSDEQVYQCVQTRLLKTLNKQDYRITPGAVDGQEPTREAVKVCEELNSDLENVDMRALFAEILSTPLFGYTVAELMYTGDRRIKDIVAKPRHWFGFNAERQLVFPATTATPNPVPEFKTLLVRHKYSYENPYGERILSRCVWPVAFKKGGVQFWMRFCNKFGLPWLLGKAPQNATSDERQAIAGDLAQMLLDAVCVVPKGTEIEALEFGSKAAEVHERLVSYWDKAIAKTILGQTLTSDIGKSATNAATQTHYAVLTDLTDGDEVLLVSAMNDLSWIYTRLRAVAGTRSPVFEFVEPEDYAEKAKLDKQLYDMGVRFTKVHFVRSYNLSKDEFGVTADPQTTPALGETSALENKADFATPQAEDETDPGVRPLVAAQAELDDFISHVLAGLDPFEGWSQDLAVKLDQAESVDDVRLLLAEYLEQEEDTPFANQLADAMTVAAMHGRVKAAEEIKELV